MSGSSDLQIARLWIGPFRTRKLPSPSFAKDQALQQLSAYSGRLLVLQIKPFTVVDELKRGGDVEARAQTEHPQDH
jgi:hypothetical protein